MHHRGSSPWSFVNKDDYMSDSGEEYVPAARSSSHHRSRPRRRRSSSSLSSSWSRRGSHPSDSLIPDRSSISSSMTSSTSVASRPSRTSLRRGATSPRRRNDDDLSSEMDSTEEDVETKRLREPSFNMAPEMSGCLLQFAVDVCHKLREGADTRNLLVSPPAARRNAGNAAAWLRDSHVCLGGRPGQGPARALGAVPHSTLLRPRGSRHPGALPEAQASRAALHLYHLYGSLPRQQHATRPLLLPDASIPRLSFVERDGVGAATCRYVDENRDVSLVILLPQRLDGLAALEKHVTAAHFLHCVARLEERHNMTVYLPGLKLKSVTDHGPVLKDMGLGVLFSDKANLSVTPVSSVSHSGTLSKAEGAHLSGARHVAVLHANRKSAVDSDNDVSPPPIGRGVVSGTVTPPSASASCPTSTTPEGALSPSSPSSPTADSSSGMNTSTALDEPSRSASQFVVDRPFMLLMLKRRPDVVLLLGTVKKLV
ncbi:hypothetical protein MRX96_042148 [Rhipicephalus microplus]